MYAIKTIIAATLLMLTLNATAQDCFYERNVHDIGIMLGSTYYMGDFNPNLTPLAYPSAYVGVLYRYNFQQYFALKGQFGFGYVRGSGADRNIPLDPVGNDWRFNRPLLFLDALAEFHFMPFDAVNVQKKRRFTPVLMLGLGVFHAGENAAGFSGEEFNSHSSRGLSGLVADMPVGIGVKWCFFPRFTLGAEWIWRLTLYDKTDYYSGVDAKHTNPIDNDWLGTVGVSVSYRIKQSIPCPAVKEYVKTKK